MQRNRSNSMIPRRRNWKNVIHPLVNYSRSENGLDFAYNFFSQIEKMLELGYQINLNIPNTLTGAHDNFLQTIFACQNSIIGQVKITPSFSKAKFQNQVENSIRQSAKKIRKKQIAQIFEDDEDQNFSRTLSIPFVVMKQKNNQYEAKNFIQIWNCYECKKVNTIDTNQILQGYIFTKNMQASITRYFYYKDNKKSTAYKIDNYENYFGKSKHRKLWKVQQSQEYSCHFVQIMHQGKSFQTQTFNLIKYLQKFYNKTVQRMVTDWIIDTSNRYFLIDLKSVTLAEKHKKIRINRSLTQLLSVVTCGMCLQACNHSAISKILTNKLIINFYEHLKKRGISLSFKINFKKIQNFSKVCDLCYNLVVAEANLIETENKMSLICNFQSDNDRKMIKKQQVLHQNLHQWRLFFYLEDIRDLAAVFNQKMDFHEPDSLYLRLMIDDSVTCFELKGQRQNNMSIKIIKVQHILFQASNIKYFLQKAQIRVQVCLKINPMQVIAQGCIRGIQNQKQLQHINLQRKYKQILLFNQNSKYCILGMYIGFCNDGMRQVNILQLKKTQHIYKPPIDNIFCQNLPSEWMQIIDQDYSQHSKTLNNKQQNLQQNITELKINQRSKSKIVSGTSMMNQQMRNSRKENRNILQSKFTLPSIRSIANKSYRQVKPRLVL